MGSDSHFEAIFYFYLKILEELFKFTSKGFKVLLTLLNSGEIPFILCPVRQNPMCGNRKLCGPHIYR